MLSQEKIKELKKFAIEIRRQTIFQIANLGVGHIGGTMSIVEFMACMYGGILNIDPTNPKMENRDRFVLSKGHAGPTMYSALALKGFFPVEELKTLNKPGTRLPSHTDMTKTPGVDMTTGSLGQGMSSSAGMALAGKIDDKDHFVYCMIGDGEMQEGQCWEAFAFASHQKLDNYIVFLDKNVKQLDGTTDEVLSLGNVGERMTAFGWNYLECDGHDVVQIWETIEKAKSLNKATNKPTFITLHTCKGKGCPVALRAAVNHNMPLSMDDYKEAAVDLDKEAADLA